MIDDNDHITENSSLEFVAGMAALYPEAISELIAMGGQQVYEAVADMAKALAEQWAAAGKPLNADHLYCMTLGHNMTKDVYESAEELGAKDNPLYSLFSNAARLSGAGDGRMGVMKMLPLLAIGKLCVDLVEGTI